MIYAQKQIPFNKSFVTGNELTYIQEALKKGQLSGEGDFIRKCQLFFEQNYGFRKAFFTSSCTDALEMSAILLDIKSGDEIIVPSYTFTSTVNAFLLRGAKIVFADSEALTPNISTESLESLISPKTKAIVPVHYAGVACNMEALLALSKKYGIYLIEDAAQCIDAFYKGKALGSLGNMGTFSFHGTKNITSGEGGMLVINDKGFEKRAEFVFHKGTNRSAFNRGETNKYEWVDIGSSYTPSEITGAFLWAQLESLNDIQNKRKEIWTTYYALLKPLQDKNFIQLNFVPDYAQHNAHIFYIILKDADTRTRLTKYLQQQGISAHSHYLALHKSPFFKNSYKGSALPNSERYEDCLLRLPLYNGLTKTETTFISETIIQFFCLSV